MKSYTLAKALALVICSFVPLTSVSQTSENLNTKLDKRLANYNLGVSNFVEALIRVSSDFQIPMGIAWVKPNGELDKFPFAWKQSTVLKIIESIVKTEPTYRVEVRGGVVRILSPGLVPENQDFLNLRIKHFEVVNEYTDLALLKVHGLISPSKHSGFSVGAEPGESRITVKLQDSTVADILDALVLNSSRKVWLVAFSTDPNPTPSGFRRTLNPWGGGDSRRGRACLESPSLGRQSSLVMADGRSNDVLANIRSVPYGVEADGWDELFNEGSNPASRSFCRIISRRYLRGSTRNGTLFSSHNGTAK